MINIAGFLIAILPIALSPGISFMLAMSNVSIAGLRSAFHVILGSGLGILIHGSLVGLGVSNIIASNSQAMTALHLVGIVFLGWLGIRLLVTGATAFGKRIELNHDLVKFPEALVLNLTNTRAIVLYMTVVPIFAGDTLSGYLLLSLIHVAMLACWILFAGWIIVTLQNKVKFAVMNGVINSLGGVSLIAVAMNMAFKSFAW